MKNLTATVSANHGVRSLRCMVLISTITLHHLVAVITTKLIGLPLFQWSPPLPCQYGRHHCHINYKHDHLNCHINVTFFTAVSIWPPLYGDHRCHFNIAVFTVAAINTMSVCPSLLPLWYGRLFFHSHINKAAITYISILQSSLPNTVSAIKKRHREQKVRFFSYFS